MSYAILAILAILVITCFANADKSDTFTVTCDKCGSTDVVVTINGLKCRNCGAEYKN